MTGMTGMTLPAAGEGTEFEALQQALAGSRHLGAGVRMQQLVAGGHARLPLPGQGATLQRWRALAEVSRHDLSLAKLYEGHTDAVAILRELHAPDGVAGSGAESLWGTWASEAPGGRVTFAEEDRSGDSGASGPDPRPAGAADLGHADVRTVWITGTKAWCSGAEHASHALLTAWRTDGRGPQLVAVDLLQPGVTVSTQAWRAIGMADSASAEVTFQHVRAVRVGDEGDYLNRPGFWHGGAGIAACWWGGALALGHALQAAVANAPAAQRTPFRLAALGRVDVALGATAALLKDTADWIDRQPADDAFAPALRARQAAEACARRVLDETGRALGATPFCRDADFARMSADLPVFIRQSHADRDDAALGERLATQEGTPWSL